jgi:hypothetical protein
VGDQLKRHAFIVTALAMIAIMLAACVKADISIAGTWEQQIEEYVVRLKFNDDKTFFLQVGDQSRKIDGEYQIRGDVILLMDDDCNDFEGKYRAIVREDSVTFSLLNDACEGRVSVVVGEWKKVENQ